MFKTEAIMIGRLNQLLGGLPGIKNLRDREKQVQEINRREEIIEIVNHLADQIQTQRLVRGILQSKRDKMPHLFKPGSIGAGWYPELIQAFILGTSISYGSEGRQTTTQLVFNEHGVFQINTSSPPYDSPTLGIWVEKINAPIHKDDWQYEIFYKSYGEEAAHKELWHGISASGFGNTSEIYGGGSNDAHSLPSWFEEGKMFAQITPDQFRSQIFDVSGVAVPNSGGME